ncbi:MAG: EAL domain-containing protein, partial [Burkholderiales bacterium]|nr:EAL domain-containing protein [Burkholderiales bacterium]
MAVSTPALEAMRRSLDRAVQTQTQTLRHILARRALTAHFQPIVRLRDGVVIGHESLIRGPAGTRLEMPDALFKAAAAEGLTNELELACVDQGLESWSRHGVGGRLFLNVSAQAIVQMVETMSLPGVMQALAKVEVTPGSIVVELTEHERVTDLGRLIEVANGLRAAGLRFALDDFGDGRSSLRLWAELHPEIVKIDRYFIHRAHERALKVQTLRGLTRLAETFGTTLVAEGIETEDELEVVRGLGIELGQGWFLGRPGPVPAPAVPGAAAAVIERNSVAVLPELTRAAAADFTVERIVVPAPVLDPSTAVDEVGRFFAADPTRRAVALVDDGRPVGLINRQSFVDRYARPYFKELNG